MNAFKFYAPTLFEFGEGAEKKTGDLVKQFGGSRVLLVYGGGSVKKNGAYQGVTEALKNAGIAWLELSGIQPNPRSGKVYEGIEICRKENLDFILAIGGGSAIDTAKAIGMGVLYDGDFWDFFSGKAPIEKTLPVGTVLTISAAGSEGSDSIVITREDGNLKWGIPRTDVVRPKFSILNPAFTCTLPAFQTACGACDMMIHIIERYFTNTPDVELTDRLSEALLKTIHDSALRAIKNPDDINARANLMWAGMLAHNNSVGIGREQDWACHQMEHELSAFYDVAHGAGLAVVVPAWMEYVMEHDIMRFARFAVNVFGCEMDFAHPERTARRGIHRLKGFFRHMGLPSNFAELDKNIKISDIPAIIEHRKQKGFPFGNFVKIDEKAMEAILRACAE